MSKKGLALLVVILAVILDQVIKIYVKTHFRLGESVEFFSWFKIHFTENNGMAMGLEFGGKAGKLFLSLFRIVAISGIVYWLIQNIKKKTHNGVLFAISLVLAGAIGNILDSVFYGVIFDEATFSNTSTLFSENANGSIFHGKVVDMFYFPFIENATLPSWIPFFGGDNFTFFQYIFNPADAFITVGVVLLFIYNKKAFLKEQKTAVKA